MMMHRLSLIFPIVSSRAQTSEALETLNTTGLELRIHVVGLGLGLAMRPVRRQSPLGLRANLAPQLKI